MKSIVHLPQLKNDLIELRELRLSHNLSSEQRTKSILRKSMLQQFLKFIPTTVQEVFSKFTSYDLDKTDPSQWQHLSQVFKITSRYKRLDTFIPSIFGRKNLRSGAIFLALEGQNYEYFVSPEGEVKVHYSVSNFTEADLIDQTLIPNKQMQAYNKLVNRVNASEEQHEQAARLRKAELKRLLQDEATAFLSLSHWASFTGNFQGQQQFIYNLGLDIRSDTAEASNLSLGREILRSAVVLGFSNKSAAPWDITYERISNLKTKYRG